MRLAQPGGYEVNEIRRATPASPLEYLHVGDNKADSWQGRRKVNKNQFHNTHICSVTDEPKVKTEMDGSLEGASEAYQLQHLQHPRDAISSNQVNREKTQEQWSATEHQRP